MRTIHRILVLSSVLATACVPARTDTTGSGDCTAGTRRCASDEAVLECIDGIWARVAQCTMGCADADCVEPTECTEDATQCDGDALQTCTDGAWQESEVCTVVCREGACSSDPCSDGEKRCNSGNVETCAGGAFAETDLCEFGCTGGVCNACADGAALCDGDDRQSCVGGTFMTVESCENGCTEGACDAAPSCTDGATRCMGDSVETCAAGVWSSTETCTDGCTAGACDVTTCTSGTTQCNGNDIETCAAGVWETTTTCGVGCSAGVCTTSVACTAGNSRCNAKNVEICNATGSAYLHVATCASGCSAGLCTGGCTPGTTRCNSGAVETCDAAGTSWSTTESCTLSCDAITSTCVNNGLEITTDTTLEGDVVVKGAFIVRSGATVTVGSTLNLRADTIEVELGGTIAASSVTPGGPCRSVRSSSNIAPAAALPANARAYNYRTQPGIGGGSHYIYYRSISTCSRGGAGGGEIRLQAAVSATVDGEIQANGSAGSNALSSSSSTTGGGGGSGGMVLVSAPTITVTGSIVARGGPNGRGYNYNGNVGQGGAIKLYSEAYTNTGLIDDGTGTTLTGTRPPETMSSSTHPSDGNLLFNDGFQSAVFAWTRPFPVTGYFWKLSTSATSVPTGADTFVSTEVADVDPTLFTAGAINYFSVVTVNPMSTVGDVMHDFRVEVNATTPSVTSASHANERTWSASTNPFFEWPTSGSFSGYRYVLDQYGDTHPFDAGGTWLDGSQGQILVSGVTPGVYMFHIVSLDHQGYPTKAATHRRVLVGADPGDGNFLGKVYDSTTMMPLTGATVTVNRGLLRGIADDETTLANGAYNLGNVPAGSWEVTVSAPGFTSLTKTASLTADGSTTLDFMLVPTP